MQRTIFFRFVCVLLSCVILCFSFVYVPVKKADAFAAVAAVTVVGVIAVTLVVYGVVVSTTDVDSSGVPLDSGLKAAYQKWLELKAEMVFSTAEFLLMAVSSTVEFFEIMEQCAEAVFASTVFVTASSITWSNYINELNSYTDSQGNKIVFSASMADLYALTQATSGYKSSLSDYYLYIYYYLDVDDVSDITGTMYWAFCSDGFYNFYLDSDPVSGIRLTYASTFKLSNESISGTARWSSTSSIHYRKWASADTTKFNVILDYCQSLGIPVIQSPTDTWSDFVGNISDWLGNSTVEENDDVLAPTLAFPAAQDVYDGTGSLDDYNIDTQDVIDWNTVADGLDVATLDDVIDGLNDGTITYDDVLDQLQATPYVTVDEDTGELATDESTNTRTIALDDDLAIPTDLTDAETYTPTGTSTSSGSGSKYSVSLTSFFPFCLPFDLYDFVSIFIADPVTPVFTADLSSAIETAVPGIYDSNRNYTITIDLTPYEDYADILRALEDVAIIVGLIMVSRKLIHGGD